MEFNVAFILLIPLLHTSEGALPKEVDWRNYAGSKGVAAGVFVSPVQDELSCNASYAFAAMAVLESRYSIKYKAPLKKLSEQNIIDCLSCDNKAACGGCAGGKPEMAWAYSATVNCGDVDGVQANGEKPWRGVNYQDVYPYTGKKQSCSFQAGASDIGAVTTIRKYNDKKRAFYKISKKMSPLEMRKAVAKGPVVVQVPEAAFNNYKGGILKATDCEETYPKRYVVIVGYGNIKKQGYWLVRNSKGSNWGENGYARLEMSMNKKNKYSWDGTCGILKVPGTYAKPTCQNWSDCY